MIFSCGQYALLLVMYVVPFLVFRRAGNASGLAFLYWALALLTGFSVACRVAMLRRTANAAELMARTKTWWWMAGTFFVAMALDRRISFTFLGLLSFWSLREYFSLLPMESPEHGGLLRRQDRSALLASYAAIPVMYYLAYVKWYTLYILIVPVYLALLVPLLLVVADRSDGFITSASVIQFGNLVFVFLLGHSAFLVNLSPLLFFYAVFLTEARDVVVYLFGKATAPWVARHPETAFWRTYGRQVAGHISPNKNLGSVLLATLATMGLALALAPLLPVFPDGSITRHVSLTLGAAIGLLGAAGDLVGSAFKRDIGVKDSGQSLPGHGGVIDRLGSLAFTLPVVFHVVKYCYFPLIING